MSECMGSVRKNMLLALPIVIVQVAKWQGDKVKACPLHLLLCNAYFKQIQLTIFERK